MEKKSLIVPVLFVFLLNFVKAQFYDGFTDFLYNIDPNAMTLGVLFIVLFAILFFSLSRIFKDKYGYPNKTIATIVALALSVLCVYWVNRTGFDTTDLFYSIGFSEEILYIIAPLIILAGLIFIFTRFKEKRFGKTLLILGGLLLVLSFTDLIYEKEFLTIISIIMIVVGLWLTLRRPRGSRGPVGGTGLSGRPGRTGRRGRSGERGGIGEQGFEGETGEQGATGRAGRKFGTKGKRQKTYGRKYGTTPRRPKPEGGREQRSAEREQRAQYKAQQKEARRQEREPRLLLTDQRKAQRSAEREQRAQQVETRREERGQERQKREMIRSLRDESVELQIEYNKIEKQNPSDPKLGDINTRLIEVTHELKRLKKLL